MRVQSARHRIVSVLKRLKRLRIPSWIPFSREGAQRARDHPHQPAAAIAMAAAAVAIVKVDPNQGTGTAPHLARCPVTSVPKATSWFPASTSVITVPNNALPRSRRSRRVSTRRRARGNAIRTLAVKPALSMYIGAASRSICSNPESLSGGGRDDGICSGGFMRLGGGPCLQVGTEVLFRPQQVGFHGAQRTTEHASRLLVGQSLGVAQMNRRSLVR